MKSYGHWFNSCHVKKLLFDEDIIIPEEIEDIRSYRDKKELIDIILSYKHREEGCITVIDDIIDLCVFFVIKDSEEYMIEFPIDDSDYYNIYRVCNKEEIYNGRYYLDATEVSEIQKGF